MYFHFVPPWESGFLFNGVHTKGHDIEIPFPDLVNLFDQLPEPEFK